MSEKAIVPVGEKEHSMQLSEADRTYYRKRAKENIRRDIAESGYDPELTDEEIEDLIKRGIH